MSTAVQPFAFRGDRVRVILASDGEAWFVAGDVCAALSIINARDAVARLAADEKGVGTTDTPGGPQVVTTVSEAGLYRLIFTSRRPDAEAFRRWVTHEVLPSIRRTGTYTAPQAAPRELSRLELIDLARDSEVARLDAERALAASQVRVAELAPVAAVAEQLMRADGDYSLREAAQVLCRDHGIDTGQNRLLRRLRELGWVDAKGTPYQRVVTAGRLAVRTHVWTHPHLGDARLDVQVRVTSKGLAYLHQHWGDGQLALAAGP